MPPSTPDRTHAHPSSIADFLSILTFAGGALDLSQDMASIIYFVLSFVDCFSKRCKPTVSTISVGNISLACQYCDYLTL